MSDEFNNDVNIEKECLGDFAEFQDRKPRRKHEVHSQEFPIGPQELLQIEVFLPNVGKNVKHDLFETLKARILDDPFSLSEEMDAAPVWYAYYGNLSAEADYLLSIAEQEYEEWFALAYEVAKDYLDGKYEKVTETMIKASIPGMFRDKADWYVSTGEYDKEAKEYNKTVIELDAYSAIKERKRLAEKNANLMKVYAKSIQFKLQMLPSQLSLAKSLLENPEMYAVRKHKDGSVSYKELKLAKDSSQE